MDLSSRFSFGIFVLRENGPCSRLKQASKSSGAWSPKALSLFPEPKAVDQAFGEMNPESTVQQSNQRIE